LIELEESAKLKTKNPRSIRIKRSARTAGKYHCYLCYFIKELTEPLHSENKKVYYTRMENVIVNSKDIEQTLILMVG